MEMATAKIKAIAPWFGGNRMLAEEAGKLLAGCEWIGVPFAGGMSELAHFTARTILVNDLHFHVINLAMTAGDPVLGPQLYRRLRRKLFHQDELQAAQRACIDWPQGIDEMPDIDLAEAYFVSQWMGRSGLAGTKDEFKGNLPIRWSAGGGDSAVRYRSAVQSLLAWRRVLQRCNFTCLDGFAFLAKAKDAAGHGLYVDAPWPDDGDGYKHRFTEADQVSLANVLHRFRHTRVVIRYADHPQIRALYGLDLHWQWHHLQGRTQSNGAKAEVLITNFAAGDA